MISGFFPSNKKVPESFFKNAFYFPEIKNHQIFDFQNNNYFFSYYKEESLPFKEKDFLYFDSNNDLIILKSGSLFNTKELSYSLSLPEDIEQNIVIAKAFIQWGPDFVKKLNGDFAIAIFDKNNEELFLYRDHVGIQPLSYTLVNKTIFFSTDNLNLCKIFSRGTDIQVDYLLSFKKYVNNQLSPNNNIKKLLPGHYLKFKNGSIKIFKYWFPENYRTNKHLKFEEVVNSLRYLIEDSVKIRNDNNYNPGVHLSGGLDSSLIAALVRKFHFNNKDVFYGFSWSPKDYKKNDLEKDERILIEKLSEKINIKTIFSDMSLDEYLEYSKKYFYCQGFFREEKVRENAKNKKVNLIYSGWGGDEFLSIGGYGILADLFWGLQWTLFFKRNPIYKPKKFIKTLFYGIFFPFLGLIPYSSKKYQKNRVLYIKKPYKKNHSTEIKNNFRYFSRRKQHLNYIYSYSIAERCEIWAVQGYRKGIVYRYPLLDKRIIEFVLQIPSALLAEKEHSRILIRELGKGIIPEEIILNNSKMDYSLYYQMNEHFKDLASILIKEVNLWKENKDLFFIDFELLEKDIWKFESDSAGNFEQLYLNIYFIKNLHEFTKTYRSLPPESE
jgi:asparagine synthase (glutamine-hydrolysing)